MSDSAELRKPLYRNWVRAALGLKYLQQGLAGFVSNLSDQRHKFHLYSYCKVTGSPAHSCTECTAENLLPEHRRKCCIQKYQSKCFCNSPTGRRSCPNNFCSRFYDLIVLDHDKRNPVWTNTDPSCWYYDHWSFARCFVATAGYSDKQSAADTDTAGLLSILINNVGFRASLDNVSNFEKARNTRNDVLHTAKYEIGEEKLTSIIDQFIGILQDKKSLINDAGAQQAVSYLEKLKKDEVNISRRKEEALRSEALQAIAEKKEEALREIAQKTNESLQHIAMAKRQIPKNLETTQTQTVENPTALSDKEKQDSSDEIVSNLERELTIGGDPLELLHGEEHQEDTPFVGVVSGTGLLDKLVHSTAYKACEDCGLIEESCFCGIGSAKKKKRTFYHVPSEIKADPRLLSLYTEALKSGQNKDYSMRVNIVGNFKQGKTTLVRRLVSKNVDDVESTNGIDVDKYICKRKVEGKLSCLTQSAEQSRAISISGKTFRNVTSPNLTKEFETDRPLAVHFWDFGGQYIFYSTHAIFHSNRAVYILVFDLSSKLSAVVKDEEYPGDTRADRNMEYFARFWMNSIHSFVGSADGREPPVILVGTHMDKLPGSNEEKRLRADKYFERVRRLFDQTTYVRNHIFFKDFAVDNTDPSDMETDSLREEIFRLGSSRAEIYNIPARWFPLTDALKKMQYLNIVSFETVQDIDSKNVFPLKDEMQIKLFLKYHHAKGTLVYFDEGTLSSHVVLNVQYLIDAFRCLVTSERFCSKDIDIRPFWRQLMAEAVLKMDLIDAVWTRDTKHDFMTHKTVLLEFLKRHHIISEVLQYNKHTGQSKGMGWFIVPSLLTCPINQNDLKEFLRGKHQTTVRMVITFDSSSIVHTVFHRLLAAALGRWPAAQIACKTLLYENLGVVLLQEDHAGIAEINGENIDLRVVNLCLSTSIDNTIADQFRRFADSFVEHEFRKLRDYDAGQGSREQIINVSIPERLPVDSITECRNRNISSYRCNHESHGLAGSVNIRSLDRLENNRIMPCPDYFTHEIWTRHARSEWFQKDGVTGIIPYTELSDKHLSSIARSIDRNWQLFACKLGLTRVQIDHITCDNDTVVVKIFKMLLQWKSMNEEHATLHKLIEVLQKCEEVTVDWDNIRNLIDEL